MLWALLNSCAACAVLNLPVTFRARLAMHEPLAATAAAKAHKGAMCAPPSPQPPVARARLLADSITGDAAGLGPQARGWDLRYEAAHAHAAAQAAAATRGCLHSLSPHPTA
jgi:hypothetical protein